MANVFKKGIDTPRWNLVNPGNNAHAAGTSLCSDLRNDISRNPFVYQLVSNAVLNHYNVITKSHQFVVNPVLAGTFGAGSTSAFVPSFGLVGTIAAGATTSKVILTTALPAAVGLNMLANRGGSGDYGYKLRIIGKVAGKTEERYIIGNTAGTTPEINVLSPFTFTPQSGDRYEIVAGRVMMLGAGTLAAGSLRSFEVATNLLASPSQVNLPATIGTDSSMLVLDEQYVPYDCSPGEGLIRGDYTYDTGIVTRKALAATAVNATTLTGQATGGDAIIAANEMRNMQIRIVEDTVTPTAVGQRRIITANTAGASPVYTLAGAGWPVATPSSSAKYVVELPNLILLRSSATTTVYTYNYTDASITNGTNTIAANAWSTTYFAAAPAANAAAGHWAPSFGIRPDVARNARHSHCHFFRGGAVTVDTLDISASITGTWSAAIVYDGATSLVTGSTGGYSPFGSEGRMHYLNVYVASAYNQIYRFDVQNRVLSPYTATANIQAGTAAVGDRIACYAALDGSDVYDVVVLQEHLSLQYEEMVVLV